jgi:thioredoxin 1
MTTINIGAQTIDDIITKNNIVLIDWWAEWCGPCKMFGPIYEKVSEKHPEIVFAKVDTEAEQQLAASAQIQSIPTLMVFKDQVLIFSQAGALQEPQLDQLIQAIKDVDMDEVRKQIEADKPKE